MHIYIFIFLYIYILILDVGISRTISEVGTFEVVGIGIIWIMFASFGFHIMRRETFDQNPTASAVDTSTLTSCLQSLQERAVVHTVGPHSILQLLEVFIPQGRTIINECKAMQQKGLTVSN